MKTWRKITPLILFLLVACMISPVHASENITIDASFSDWNEVSMTTLSNSDFDKVAMSVQGDMVYLYVSEKKSLAISWGSRFSIRANNGQNLSFSAVPESYNGPATQSLQLRDGSWQEMSDCQAMGEKLSNNAYQWEIGIPLSRFGDASSVSLYDNTGKVLIADVPCQPSIQPSAEPSIAPTPAPTVSPSVAPSVTYLPPATSIPEGNGPIVIDGYYDDWKNIDVNEAISWLSNNATCWHHGGIVKDDDYVYVHIALHDYYITQIPLTDLTITVNKGTGDEKKFSFGAHFMNSDQSIDWSKDSQVYNLPLGNSSLGLFWQQNNQVYLGDIEVSRFTLNSSMNGNGQPTKIPNDQFEFKMSLDTIAQITGMPKDSIQSLTFSSDNLGKEGITTTGTPTGAYIGIALSVLVVAFVFYKRKRKQVIH